MIKEYLNNRFLILYVTPFIIGALTVFSFQPFNLTIINFFILPIFFIYQYILIKNQKVLLEKNLIEKIYLYLDFYLVLDFT